MPIIRQPNQSYERNFGNIRLYLDDLDDVYRQLAECAETTIGVGQDGVAPTIDDLRDSDKAGLRQVRLTTTAPDIIINFNPRQSSGVALKGGDSARRMVDNIEILLAPKKRNMERRVKVLLIGLFLIGSFINIGNEKNNTIFLITLAFILVDLTIYFSYDRIAGRSPAIIPYRRREAALAGRRKKVNY